LVLAATPLGNVGDASARLREALASADIVAAEDTRRLRTLAAALGVTVTGRVVSHYDAVEAARLPALLDAVRAGQTVLVLTDAGMPTVSDPGYRLVSACAAVTTALAVSGLPTERFCFEGFAPRKPTERRRWLSTLAAEPRTAVFFEAPHRLAACLADAADVLGGARPAAVCRELTKLHEEVLRGTLASLAAWAAECDVRGEITVVLGPAPPPPPATVADLVPEVRRRVEAGERLKDAAAAVAAEHGASRRDLYNAALTRTET
jgi:16S rRNA (cytidine1402-2'-O)-methyltransferase